MRAAFFVGRGQPLEVREIKKPRPIRDQVLIKLHYAALNHLDVWIRNDQNPVTPQGNILGADGCGVVEGVGEDADSLMIGMEVIILPSLDWGSNPAAHGDQFRILGFPDSGTFSDYLVISKKYVFEKPEHLTLEESAAVPLAGLTAYRALFTKARLRQNEKILITGIGGGAAMWTLQFAHAYKARVFVSSSSEEKLQRAKQLGAAGGVNYTHPEWPQQLTKEAGFFDIAVDSAAGKTFSSLPEVMLPGGRIVLFGRTQGIIPELSPRLIYWKQLSILGTTMGTRDEFLSMIDLIESRKVKPVIDQVYPLEKINDAFQRMESGKHFGKIVIKIN